MAIRRVQSCREPRLSHRDEEGDIEECALDPAGLENALYWDEGADDELD